MWAGCCQVAELSCMSLPFVQQLSPTLSALAPFPGQAGQNTERAVSQQADGIGALSSQGVVLVPQQINNG